MCIYTGNLVVDVMRQVTHTDVAIINSGTMRSDATHGPGQIKMKVASVLIQLLTLPLHHPFCYCLSGFVCHPANVRHTHSS